MAYSHARPITIDHTKCGTADSTNFPVLISGLFMFLATMGNGGEVQNASGYDVAFFADQALTTPLSWEVERYVATTGELEAWVKIPTLSHSADPVVYLADGDPTISTFQGGSAGAAWNANARAVYHCSDNAASATVAESTSNADTGTAQRNTSLIAATGQIAGGFALNGTTDYVAMAADPLGASGAADFSIFVWAKTSNTALRKDAVSIGDALTTNHGAFLYVNPSNQVECDLTNVAGPHSTATVTDGAWHRIGVVCSGSTLQIYVDGSASGTPQAMSPALASLASYFGGHSNAAAIKPWNGSLDEVQCWATALSTSWITADWNSQNSPSTFVSVGADLLGHVAGGWAYHRRKGWRRPPFAWGRPWEIQ